MVKSSFQSCMKINSKFYHNEFSSELCFVVRFTGLRFARPYRRPKRRSDDGQTETSITKTQMNHFFCNFQDFKKETFKTVEISVSKSYIDCFLNCYNQMWSTDYLAIPK